MVTIRNLGGASLFLAGTTWLWLTPAFAGRGVATSGPWWAATRVLCLLAVAGFSAATFGLFVRASWWEPAALGAAAVGLVAIVSYWVAAARGGEPAGTAAWNVFVHLLIAAGVFTLLLVPALERWVGHHVMRG